LPSQSALAPILSPQINPITYGNSPSFGIRPKNKEQHFAFELLLNDDIKVATIIGRAGTGKTLLALAIGLEKVVEQKFYTRLLVTRPVVPIGNDLGYLPALGKRTAASDCSPYMTILNSIRQQQPAIQDYRSSD